MKKVVILFLLVVFCFAIFALDANAAKKSKKGISDEEKTQMETTIDDLTKKMYARGLFSPEDNSNLISIKLKLDNQMLVSPDVSLAPYYFKMGILLKSRDMKEEAVDCFQTILENFASTALAPKAMAQLKAMGVAVNTIATPQDGVNAGQ